MAALWKTVGKGLCQSYKNPNDVILTFRNFSFKNTSNRAAKGAFSLKYLTPSIAALATSYIVYKKYNSSLLPSNFSTVFAKQNVEPIDPPLRDPLLDSSEKHNPTLREQRFHRFGSVEYQGSVFMTPRDFLESITYDNPRYRTGRLKLNKAAVDKLLQGTPSIKRGSSNMFRKISEQGIISFTEYLFLLCVLTKPRSGFKIAFNMFDLDGDERVDKMEFLVLEQLLAHTEKTGVETSLDLKKHRQREKLRKLYQLVHLEPNVVKKRPRNIWDLLAFDFGAILSGHFIEPLTDTTLMVHFFGSSGKDVMTYEDFSRFMENLQTEVLELEFAEFSSGLKTITEIEFAQILLRYTKLSKLENDNYLNRLRSRITHPKGISFTEFKMFCQFLNSIDDFSLAMRIYSYADHPISQADFTRAVKACSGQNLSPHVINVVFQLFDVDGDGKLSHKEFISVMKERVHRGAKHKSNTRWDHFKNCIKNQLKTSGTPSNNQ